MTQTREEWLLKAAEVLNGRLLHEELPLLKVSVGWPKGVRSGHALGQCWSKKASQDGDSYHIFVSPVIQDTVEVLRVLLHELIHAAAGTEAGHKGTFAKMAKRVGFEQPWTSTPATLGLLEVLKELVKELGSFPHPGLNPPMKKQTTRMKLWVCACGVKIRRAGDLHAKCLDCNSEFEREE